MATESGEKADPARGPGAESALEYDVSSDDRTWGYNRKTVQSRDLLPHLEDFAGRADRDSQCRSSRPGTS